MSLLCDCIVLALLERDLKERVACGCVPYAFLVSLLFGIGAGCVVVAIIELMKI